MTKRQFKIWLEGYLELSDEKTLTHSQIIIILNHAKLVLIVNKIDDEDLKIFMDKIRLYADPVISTSFSRADLKILIETTLVCHES